MLSLASWAVFRKYYFINRQKSLQSKLYSDCKRLHGASKDAADSNCKCSVGFWILFTFARLPQLWNSNSLRALPQSFEHILVSSAHIFIHRTDFLPTAQGHIFLP